MQEVITKERKLNAVAGNTATVKQHNTATIEGKVIVASQIHSNNLSVFQKTDDKRKSRGKPTREKDVDDNTSFWRKTERNSNDSR